MLPFELPPNILVCQVFSGAPRKIVGGVLSGSAFGRLVQLQYTVYVDGSERLVNKTSEERM